MSLMRHSRRYKPLRVTMTDDRAPLAMWDAWDAYHEAVLADLTAANRGAVEALRRYGRHDLDCAAVSGPGACDCGYDEALPAAAVGRQ
jgi:hypothetical protein